MMLFRLHLKEVLEYAAINIKLSMRNNMIRKSFILSVATAAPLLIFAKIKSLISTRPSAGFKVSSGQARFGVHYKMKGVTQNTLDIKISEKDTAGDLAVFEQTGLTPKGGPPLHIHPHQDEWFYVIEGEYIFQVGDEKFQMDAGDTIFLPRNIPHAFIQLTDNGKMIVSYLPAGKMEAFFATTDQWQSIPSKEEVAKVFADHDMEVVGLPLTID